MFKYIPLMLKNSLRNRRRSILTIASVAASLCLLGLLMAMYHAFFFAQAAPEQALRLVTRNKISLAVVMPISYEQKIQQVPGVRTVMASMWFGGVYKDPKNIFARFAVEPDKLFDIHPEYKITEEEKKAFKSERTACIIGRRIATKYNIHLGDRITLVGDIFPVNLEMPVRGIYEDSLNNETLYFRLEYLWELLSVGRRDFAGTYNVLADSPESVSKVAQGIDDQFRNSPVQTKTETEQAFQLSFISFLGNVKMFLLSICGAVTFTILLVSANTMAMSVRERLKEVGILKTLGFTNGAILGIILGEAGFLSLIGAGIGCFLAFMLTAVVRNGPAFLVQLKTLTIGPTVAILIIVAGVAIGVASSLLPAWTASRTPILDSLRNAG